MAETPRPGSEDPVGTFGTDDGSPAAATMGEWVKPMTPSSGSESCLTGTGGAPSHRTSCPSTRPSAWKHREGVQFLYEWLFFKGLLNYRYHPEATPVGLNRLDRFQVVRRIAYRQFGTSGAPGTPHAPVGWASFAHFPWNIRDGFHLGITTMGPVRRIARVRCPLGDLVPCLPTWRKSGGGRCWGVPG